MPPGQLAKSFPPKGYTGKRGVYPPLTQVTNWVGYRGDHNIAIRLPPGVVGIDVDAYDGKAGAATLASLDSQLGPWTAPTEPLIRSTSRDDTLSGIYLFKAELLPETRWRGELGPGIDLVHAGHRYVMAAPSVHPTTGRRYRWLQTGDRLGRDTVVSLPRPEGLATLAPAWLERATRPVYIDHSVVPTSDMRFAVGEYGTNYGLGALRQETQLLRRVWDANGSFNNQLNRSAFALGQLVAGRELYAEHAEAELFEVMAELGVPEDQIKTFWSGFNSGMEQPRARQPVARPVAGGHPEQPEVDLLAFSRTDLGNAERVAALFTGRLGWSHGRGWMWYDGSRWRVDNGNTRANRGAQEIARLLKQAIQEADRNGDFSKDERGDSAELKKWHAFAHSNGSDGRLRAMLNQAKSLPEISIEDEWLDADPNRLATPGGVIDLRTGDLTAATPSQYVTRITAVPYEPDTACPDWMAFLDWFTGSDPDLIDYFQLVAGSALIGSNQIQAAYWLHGEGSTGKSTFCNTLRNVLGDYAATAQTDLLAFRPASNSGHTDSLAYLAGARYVLIPEIPKGWRLNESLFKQLTGGDAVQASFKGKPTFEFVPKFTMVMYGNERPNIQDSSSGTWRRLKLVETRVHVPKGQQVHNYWDVLVDKEGPGILAWMVKGAMRLLAGDRMEDPATIVEAVARFRDSQDDVKSFVLDSLDFGSAKRISNRDLWTLHQRWVEAGGSPLARDAQRLGNQVMDYATREGQPVERPLNAFKYGNGARVRGLRGVGAAPAM